MTLFALVKKTMINIHRLWTIGWATNDTSAKTILLDGQASWIQVSRKNRKQSRAVIIYCFAKIINVILIWWKQSPVSPCKPLKGSDICWMKNIPTNPLINKQGKNWTIPRLIHVVLDNWYFYLECGIFWGWILALLANKIRYGELTLMKHIPINFWALFIESCPRTSISSGRASSCLYFFTRKIKWFFMLHKSQH